MEVTVSLGLLVRNGILLICVLIPIGAFVRATYVGNLSVIPPTAAGGIMVGFCRIQACAPPKVPTDGEHLK